jgi:hypothetical protein
MKIENAPVIAPTKEVFISLLKMNKNQAVQGNKIIFF